MPSSNPSTTPNHIQRSGNEESGLGEQEIIAIILGVVVFVGCACPMGCLFWSFNENKKARLEARLARDQQQKVKQNQIIYHKTQRTKQRRILVMSRQKRKKYRCAIKWTCIATVKHESKSKYK